MKNLFIYLAIGFGLFCFVSCQKKPNHFSDWKINEMEYHSNKVTVDIGKGAVEMVCQEPDGFSLGWYTSLGFPDREGMVWRVADGMQGTIGLGIYSQGKYYIVAPNEVKYAHSRMGEGTIEIVVEPVWYVNYADPADSVLIEGIFRRP